MSNPLKRVLDPNEVDHVTFKVSSTANSGVDSRRPSQQETWPYYYTTFPDAPQQSQYLAPTYMNPRR